jgi:hypothetical protein
MSLTAVETSVSESTLQLVGKADVAEEYDGSGYRFAPIEEAQVTRAMIKRYIIATQNWGFRTDDLGANLKIFQYHV